MTLFKEKYGPWALVTGASSGIGREFAKQLAEKGVNVVVAARRKSRLAMLVRELEKTHGVQTRVIEVDLTAPDYLATVSQETADLDIGLLINNAGSAAPGAFLKQSLGERTRVTQLNVLAPMQLAHHFGSQMSQQGRGGIIFVSSMAAYTGSPYLANYAATKAYLLQFGEALSVELKPKGVDVLVLSPGATRTEMAEMDGTDMSKVPMTWMTAEAVAEVGLKALGQKTAVIPGTLNNMMTTMMTRIMPRKAALTMFGSMMAKTMDPALL
ncbi:MAG: SDR family oxidoreductase [Chloroflexota bacterium]